MLDEQKYMVRELASLQASNDLECSDRSAVEGAWQMIQWAQGGQGSALTC